ncbi:MAG: hypothetical protein ABSB82_16585 [Terriglobia bacterium]|jgi:hypothetical protein
MVDPSENLRLQVGSNHRRVISVRLRILEESWMRLLDLFRPMDSILTARRALPREKAEEVRQQVLTLGAKLAEMKTDLGLERSDEDPAREARALIAAMITGIEELHPHYLRGYGKVPESLESYLETRLKGLLQVMDRIAKTLARPVSEGKSKG